MIHILAGRSRMVWSLVMLLRVAHNLKFMNCLFVDFPFDTFKLQWTMNKWNHGEWNTDNMGGCTTVQFPWVALSTLGHWIVSTDADGRCHKDKSTRASIFPQATCSFGLFWRLCFVVMVRIGEGDYASILFPFTYFALSWDFCSTGDAGSDNLVRFPLAT